MNENELSQLAQKHPAFAAFMDGQKAVRAQIAELTRLMDEYTQRVAISSPERWGAADVMESLSVEVGQAVEMLAWLDDDGE